MLKKKVKTCHLIYYLIIILFSSCSSYKKVPTSIQNNPNTAENKTIKSLDLSVEKIVNAGGNLKRGKSIVERANDFNLSEYTSLEKIDFFSFQKNILIDIKGKEDKIVYIVAHYDKTDINPLKLISILLNGILDPLISWSYTSDGAIDNATGVAISLELAKKIAKEDLKYNYRILLVGAEESGLRGSRAHVARLSNNTFNKILYVINTDAVGVKSKTNCVTSNVSNSILSQLSIDISKELNIEFGVGKVPSLSCSDYASFKKTSFTTDFSRSLAFNVVGAFLPQRSYFTKKKETEIINFSSCNVIDAGDYIGNLALLPIGSFHGFRDSIKRVDEKKMYEQYLLIYSLIKRVEELNLQL